MINAVRESKFVHFTQKRQVFLQEMIAIVIHIHFGHTFHPGLVYTAVHGNRLVINKASAAKGPMNQLFLVIGRIDAILNCLFKKQMSADPRKKLHIAVIYSFGANEAIDEELLDEENPEDTSGLEESSRDFLDHAIDDYNDMFHTRYDTSGEKFQNYYKDVSLRMKNKELDLLIVVNMFLTGFDATTLNTLWVDKNLKMHGLIQAFSRTNRILNSVKTFGNIVCFRNLQKRVDDATSLFGDKNASTIVLLKSFNDYYSGYEDEDGVHHCGYTELVGELAERFPLTMPRFEGERMQKDFIALFGTILRTRNILTSFDDFDGKDVFSERDFQDYLGRYQDLKEEWTERRKHGDAVNISDDVVFETELIQQVEINIDYIFHLVRKYHDLHIDDEETMISVRKAIDASPELRSKKALIETFLAGIEDIDDYMAHWRAFIAERREAELDAIIETEGLKPEETKRFIEDSFRVGELKTVGTDIDRIMPPISRFGGARARKRAKVNERLEGYFRKFYGAG